MKKITALLLVLLMLTSLFGCSSEKSTSPAPGTDLTVFYQAVLDAQPEDAEELILFKYGGMYHKRDVNVVEISS